MKLSKLYSKSLWKDSFLYAVSFIAAIETICAIANFSITDICNIQKWWEKGLVIVGVIFIILAYNICSKGIQSRPFNHFKNKRNQC